METKRQKTLPTEITLGRYIFERLKQVGIGTIFGVPGDFNLALLDHIYEVEGLRWAGNANELNAACAADGYSRVNGLSCVITTFGVGELSALNGVAGAYAEHVGLIHLVGVPSISAREKNLLLHHTLGNGDFNAFQNMSKVISKTQVYIDDIHTAPSEIDRVIKDAYLSKRAVYLALPTNFVEMTVQSALLNVEIDLELKPNDPEAEEECVVEILDKMTQAENPIILVDACAIRHDVRNLVAQIAKLTNYLVFTTPMGKSSIDESYSRYGGVYIGVLSNPDVKETVESSDLILSVGGLLSDFNTGSFSYEYHTTNVIEFHSDSCKVRKATYEGMQMQFVLKKIISYLESGKYDVSKYVPKSVPESVNSYTQALSVTSGKISQDWLWKRISTFLREGDIIITETGTAAFGIVQTHFPKDVFGISQVLWGSIGYTVGSTLGAAMAAEELFPDRRVILFIGDGSLQLTVQEISTMCRWKLNPYLFVLNNDGYTIEKLIHGPTAQYNAIQTWDHSKILPLFHGDHVYENYKLSTIEDLNSLYESEEFNKPDKIRLIELMLDEMDAPVNLVKQAEFSAKTNSSE